MSSTRRCVLVLLLMVTVDADSNDYRFNFDETRDDHDYGPEDWNKVECEDANKCLGFPDPFPSAVGWSIESVQEDCEKCVPNDVKNNNCKWCPLGGDCGQTRQSPIDLLRNRGLLNHPESKECPDWHHMKFFEGACKWDDIIDNDSAVHRNNFLIRRHALQILTPVNEDGELQCKDDSIGGRVFPRLDVSKGFPDWFFHAFTEISVPSQHTSDGKRFSGEVTMTHFYEESDIPQNQLGKINVFLEAVDGAASWPYLDKLICQWRETEEQVRKDCGLDSVKTFYPGCSNYKRGHSTSTPAVPTGAALAPSPPIPSPTFGGNSSSHVPKVYPKCSICGSANLFVTNVNATVNMPSFPSLSCVDMESLGFAGYISPALCDVFPAFVTQCDCKENQIIPTQSPVNNSNSSSPAVPPDYDCPRFDDTDSDININYERICDSCCDPDERSDTSFCHSTYKFFDSKMPSVCYHCCEPSIRLAPAPAPHPDFEAIDCTEVDNPHRLCNPEKETSCCRDERSDTSYCKDAYSSFGDLINSVCWYCCSKPTLVGPPLDGDNNRRLRAEMSPSKAAEKLMPKEVTPERRMELMRTLSEREQVNVQRNEKLEAFLNPIADARIRYLKAHPPSGAMKSDEKHEAIFNEMVQRFLAREDAAQNDQGQISQRRLVNYDDVPYFTYEWLLKVKTEYYFRYEGTQTVPPCKDQAHFRVMKDPIVVPPTQIEELERLLIERIAPKDSEFKACEPDHAGAPRKNSPGKYDFVRPLQQNHKAHRMVFCECKDWKSVFEEDRRWCSRGIQDRFFVHRFNFD